jgi:hypothetical protein
MMFKAERISQTATIRLKGRFDQIFPLFGPVREKDWAEGWDPHILFSNSDNIEEHMVFQTHSHLDDEKGVYTWTVSTFVPEEGKIEYTIFAETRLWWIMILCEEESEGEHCKATITYTFVGLTKLGNDRNAMALTTMYKHDLKDWELAINHYLETGSKLRHH